MRLFLLTLLSVIAILIYSCKTKIIFFYEKYKGVKLHEHPALISFSNQTDYIFTTLVHMVLRSKFDNKIKWIIASQNIVSLSVTTLIPFKGMWQLDIGFIANDNTKPA